jgi:hypothetical protein
MGRHAVTTGRLLALLAMVLCIAWSSASRADELDALYARILREPANTELNLRFARLAEERGTLRWALMAYERVLVNDPGNFDAKLGLMRIKSALAPNTTMVTVAFGTAYESNPLYYLPDGKSTWLAQGSVALRDERNLAGQRWRTDALVGGQINSRYGEINYGYAGGETGPVFYALPGLTITPALGAAAAYFDNRFYYGEGSGSLTFENTVDGYYRALRLRAAYRSYDDFFPSQEGWYAEARGRFTAPNVLGEGSVAIFAPWLIWSDISGIVVNSLVQEIQPGAYVEWGGRVEVYKAATQWLTIGASLAVSWRDYRREVVVATGAQRADTMLMPGVVLLFPGFFWKEADLRLDYRYLHNSSNDATKEFDDHIVSATVVKRFDPTLPIWGQGR